MAVQGVITTAPGLEPALAQEARAAGATLQGSAVPAPGYLGVRVASPAALAGLLGTLGTAHRVGVELARGQVDPRDPWQGFQALVNEAPWEPWVAPGASFSLRCERHGEHPFRSPEVQDRVGGMIHRALDHRLDAPVSVDLEAPQAALRLTLDAAGRALLWLDLAGPEPLHRRGYHRHPHPAGMKPTLAAGLLATMGYTGQGRLVDPMAGTGTLAIEAAWRAHGIPPVQLRRRTLTCQHAPATGPAWELLVASAPGRPDDAPEGACQHAGILAGDLHAPHLDGLAGNARAAGVARCITPFQGPVAELDEHVDACTFLVANPPYGMRSSDPSQVHAVHGQLVAQAGRLLTPGGRLGLMTPHLAMVETLAEEHGLLVDRSLAVLHGRLPIQLIVLAPG